MIAISRGMLWRKIFWDPSLLPCVMWQVACTATTTTGWASDEAALPEIILSSHRKTHDSVRSCCFYGFHSGMMSSRVSMEQPEISMMKRNLISKPFGEPRISKELKYFSFSQTQELAGCKYLENVLGLGMSRSQIILKDLGSSKILYHLSRHIQTRFSHSFDTFGTRLANKCLRVLLMKVEQQVPVHTTSWSGNPARVGRYSPL